MAEYQEYLAMLEGDPKNREALVALQNILPKLEGDEVEDALAKARDTLRERGELEAVLELLDVEIDAASDEGRRADLLLQKGHLFVDELLNEKSGVECFQSVLELRPDDEDAQETLEHLGLVRENWQQIIEKYLTEAKASTDRELTTSLYLSVAETYARYQPDSDEVEQYLLKALEVDQGNRRAANHLERLYRRRGEWQKLAEHIERRVDAAKDKKERIAALINLAELAAGELGQRVRAIEAMKKVVAIDPGNARALSLLSDAYQADENWSSLVMLYTNALKARRRGSGRDSEIGTLLQIAMLHWKRLENTDAAEEFFRRIRKLEPAHPAALDFYRSYYLEPERQDVGHLLQVLRQAQKSVQKKDTDRAAALSVEIAELAENQLGNPEKAIDAWKGILRNQTEGERADAARAALKRLYAKTQKWNALLDLTKEEVDRLPPEDIAGRIAGLESVVEIYRDQLKLDVMVINTYNSILALDPDNGRALDALAEKYESLSRWNDLVGVLTRKAESESRPLSERVAIFNRIASLWIDRFGNYAQAVKPLERIVALCPPGSEDGAAAAAQLKDIYTRRRQWRALIGLLGRESEALPMVERRPQLTEMARLAAERLGDNRLAIHLYNRVLELPGSTPEPGAAHPELGTVLSGLAHLYEREKRYLALTDIYDRQRRLVDGQGGAVPILEKLGTLYADRLDAPLQAADVYRQILMIEPDHSKAARQLRELYAASGDFDALEQVYGTLGQWDELIEALHAIADRRGDRSERLELLERAARIAAAKVENRDRVARCYERILSVEPEHLEAATALAPIYRETKRWARLLGVLEIELGHARRGGDEKRQLELMTAIRELCEHEIGSKSQAFEWAGRAWRLAPEDQGLLADLERLGAEADAWEEVAEILAARAAAESTEESERLRLYRELGKISHGRLHRPGKAHDYFQKVLELAPGDAEATDALEEIATQQADWPSLLAIYRGRAAAEPDNEEGTQRRLDLLFKIAFIEEERLAEHESAISTFEKILEIEPGSRRALKSLARLYESGGDFFGVARALEGELALASDPDTRVDLHLRIGALYQKNLDRPGDAREHYLQALEHGPSSKVHAALEPFLDDEDSAVRAEIAEKLLPAFRQAGDAVNIARCLERLREVAPEGERVDWDRKLFDLYSSGLSRPRDAFEAGLRVFAADPADGAIRSRLLQLADEEAMLPALSVAYRDRLSTLADDEDAAPLRLELAVELAELFDERLEDLVRAEAAWTGVLELDPTSRAAYEALDRIYRNFEDWGSLRQILIARAENTIDVREKLRTLTALCELSESILGDPDGAVRGYKQILELDPDDLGAYKALERLYADRESWAELETLLAAEAACVNRDDERAQLLLRRAMLRGQFLGDRPGAVELVEDLLSLAPKHPGARDLLESMLEKADVRLRVAQILEPLYAEDGSWHALAQVLSAQAEFAEAAGRVELLARVAEIEEVRLGAAGAALAAWQSAIETDPSDDRALANLLRLAAETGEHAEVAAALEGAVRRVEPGDVSLRARLRTAIAEIYDRDLGDPISATRAYRALYEIDPHNPESALPAAEALSRLYEQAHAWDELVTMLRRRAEWSASPSERRDLLAEVAEIQEQNLGERDAAVAAWRDVLAEDGDDRGALDALARLYRAADQSAELAEILRRRIDVADDPEVKCAELRELARVQEETLDRPDDAVAAYLEILDYAPGDGDSLAQLARLYRAASRWSDLLDVIERQLPRAEDASVRAQLMLEEAYILDDHLERRTEALERYGDVLALEPDRVDARSRLEAMLEDPGVAIRACEVLEPLYEANGDHADLAALLERRAGLSGDPRRQIEDLRNAARVRETALEDAAGAWNDYVAACRVALAEPDLAEILGEVERLAEACERMDDLIGVYRELAPDVLDGELQRRLYLDIADLSRAVGDADGAREHYQRVLDARPDDRRALVALEQIYRDAGENEKLYEVLSRRADLETQDLDAKAKLLGEAAAVCAESLGRSEDAMLLWEQVLELTPSDRRAADALEDLYITAERWHDVAELTERRLGFAFTVAEGVELQLKLGDLYERHIGDPEAAFEAYATALRNEPGSVEARAALERYLEEPGLAAQAANLLEPVYIGRQQWEKLVKIYEIKLEVAADPAERLALTRYIARLFEDQLEDLDGAFRWYGRVFRESPEDRAVRDQLVRLANILDRWDSLANIYQEFLDDEAGDTPAVRQVALEVARIYDERLGEIDRGQAAYRRVLEATPDDLETFSRLERMLTRTERWYALCDCYEEAIHSTLDDARRQELYLRLAEIQEDKLEDSARAVDAYIATLNVDPDNQAAIASLDRLYKEQEQWYELADLLRKQIDSAPDLEEKSLHRARLAELLEQKLQDPVAAIDEYEQMIAEGAVNAALPPLERLVIEEAHRERIAYLLEPIYRERDWWQKLVVILDTKLAYIQGPAERVEVLREIARIHETRGGDSRLALEALARAWHEDVSDYEIYEELGALGARLGAWQQLIDALDAGIKDVYDFELVGRVLARIAEIQESQFNDPQAAIKTWRRYLDIEEDNRAALAALDRLLADGGHHEELARVLARRAELAEDPSIRQVLYRRLAQLNEEHLDSRADAIAAYKSVLAVDASDRGALDALERLYRAEKDHTELADVLARKIEVCEDAEERRSLRFALGLVYRTHLSDAYEAIAQMQLVLDENPEDRDALAELDGLYKDESMWPELLEVIDRRARLEPDAGERADLAFRAAKLVETELLEPHGAIERLAAVLELDPKHPGARSSLEAMTEREEVLEEVAAVLERIYRAEEAHRQLAELYEKRLAAGSADPVHRSGLYVALAELHEVARGDLDAAFATWARALRESPDDESIWGQLERLAADRGSWEELASLYEQQLADTVDSELACRFAVKLADLYEQALGDLERAARARRTALETGVDEADSLAALARIYELAGQWAELVDILRMQADAALSEEAQSELLFRIGDVRETQLADNAGAISAYREVMDRDRGHSAARAALERMLVQNIDPPEVIGILEPIYETEGDAPRLAELLAHKLTLTTDRLERAQIYARIAEIAETQLGDTTRAMDAAGGWLAEDPGSEQALEQLERLAEVDGRWSEVAARLQGIIASSDSADVAAALEPRLGEVQLQRLGDLRGAEATFEKVLAREPESRVALASLETIYRRSEEPGSLAAILERRAHVAFDVAEKRDALAEAARLYEQIGDEASAERDWKEVLDGDEGDHEAHTHLAAIYERADRSEDLIDILGVAARFANDAAAERDLRARIARLHDEKMGDLDRAADSWRNVLDLDPTDMEAYDALESVLARREDWNEVTGLLERRVDVTDDSGARIVVLTRLARVHEQRLESVDDAAMALRRVLEIEPGRAETQTELERLYERAERWHELVELREQAAAAAADRGDADAEVRCLAAAADVWEGPLENPEAAGEMLEKILERDPDFVPALTRLARIYERNAEWEKCGEVLERALALGPTGTDAAELQVRLAEVELARGGDAAKAAAALRQALEHDASFAPAIDALARQAREDEDWPLLADMLGRRYQAETGEEERRALAIELAQLYAKRLGQPEAMTAVLEDEAAKAPDDPELLGALADAYFAAGRYADAAPIFSTLAEKAKKERRMKDVARYRQKAAELFEAQGEIEEAQAAYEEAFRIDPTNVGTMAGLGRIYLSRSDWEKARRVYRSMVLQTLDADVGITKADVYYNLGYIHAQLGEINKAKGMMQRGLELDPEHERIKQALASL